MDLEFRVQFLIPVAVGNVRVRQRRGIVQWESRDHDRCGGAPRVMPRFTPMVVCAVAGVASHRLVTEAMDASSSEVRRVTCSPFIYVMPQPAWKLPCFEVLQPNGCRGHLYIGGCF